MRAAFPSAPDEADNEVCEDGTACHWLAQEVWEGRFPPEGSLAPNGRVLIEEMYDAVDLYHGVLRSEFWHDAETYCEKAVKCDVIFPGMTGTPDAQSYKPGRLRIVDLKFGFRFVEVWDNYQLIIYAVSVAAQMVLPPTTVIELVIVQPRSNHRDGPVRTWTTTLGALDFHVATLRAAAQNAMSSEAPMCVPNPGCTDCAGRHACVSLQNSALTTLEVSHQGVPLELSADALGDELRRLKDASKKLEARITGLEGQADSLLRKGAIIPGWTLAPTFARETWKEGKDVAVITLEKYYPNVSLSKPPKAITPAQARKLIPAEIVAVFAHKPSTGMRLTKTDPYAAMKAFQQPQGK